MTATLLQFPLTRQWHINRIAAEMVAASQSGDPAQVHAACKPLPSLTPAENSAVWLVYLTLKGDEGGAA